MSWGLITQQQVDRILVDDQAALIKSVPLEIHAWAYDNLMQTNPDWYIVVRGLATKLSNSKSRSKKMGFTHSLILRDLARIWLSQKGRCALTNQLMTVNTGSTYEKNPFGLSIDRIDSNKGYDKNNIRLLCHWANNAKSTYDDSLFESFVLSSARKIINA